ncbi:MAG: ATP-binding protein [Devosia sp.]|nr:ATP-binding protein [Devosia sp.]
MARKTTANKAPSGVAQPGRKDLFATFFEEPSRTSLRALLQDETGETREVEFKREWPKSGPLAKHILGMANAGRGVLIVGVEELATGALDPIGLPELTDKANILNSIKGLLPTTLRNDLLVQNFFYEGSEYERIKGKMFQVLLVQGPIEHAPFVALKDGEGIREGAIYMRRQAVTSEASYDEVQRLLNKWIETRYSSDEEMDLKVHIEQLKVPVGELPSRSLLFGSRLNNTALFGAAHPVIEAEPISEFLARMIRHKKLIIAEVIGLSPEHARASEDLATRKIGMPSSK